ncbi:hypothetical protein GCM10009762_04890 [Dermacoccus barathri]|uniref:Glycosyltransferase n=1 Tax=Dermacoccus barathri TaxID=322601 RepID=A0ABN2B7G0_9MICO
MVFLAEQATAYAPFAWLAARASGSPLVVDGFIGLHETRILDWKKHPESSLAAKVYFVSDWLAARLADLYLTDTEIRAQRIRGFTTSRTDVMSLPVGAPSWARSLPRRTHESGKLRILYYGNFIPLHGVSLLLRAVAQASSAVSVELTLIGPKKPRGPYQELADQLGLFSNLRWLDPVAEDALIDQIAEHDVVAGVFGDSLKAQSVIANKTWQGLAAGRPVLTQRSQALEEIAPIVGEQLIVTEPGSVDDLADRIVDLARRGELPNNPSAAADLEMYVQHRFEALGKWIRDH